ncbi:TonB family protein [Halioxenophilus aromaticivorans]|uniref:TonB C-terminal domain-containing protein n=1 Tax=Halioxenophilus aromaticivorans TaxID=1306992 RepID=A0AAV3U124_9ALTE
MRKLIPSLLFAGALVGFQPTMAEERHSAIKADFSNVASIETVKDVAPAFPRLAVRTGAEGHVVLSYNLDVNGKPVDVKVVEEHPKRVFTSSAVKALKASRFSVTDDEGTSYAVKGLARRYDFQRPEAELNRTARN